MLCVFFEGGFRWHGDVGMLWAVQRNQSWRTIDARLRMVSWGCTLCSPALHTGAWALPLPPIAKQRDQQAALMGDPHQAPGFVAPLPRRDKEEEVDS